jgi:hypothetical protein
MMSEERRDPSVTFGWLSTGVAIPVLEPYVA